VKPLRERVSSVGPRASFVGCALFVAFSLTLMACGGASGGLRTGAGGVGGQGGDDLGGSGPVDVTVIVDVTDRHQTLVGFGGAVAFYTNFLSGRTDDIFKVLFVDMGIDILRVGNWYQNQSASGTTPDSAFTDTATVAIVQKAAAALGHPPKILMSSWSPPAYLKSNGLTKGSRGTLLQSGGAYQYAQFGDWWVRSIAAYSAQGVAPDYISIQNEPDFFNKDWETCQLDSAEDATNAGYGSALDAVSAAIAASTLGTKPQIVGPETSGVNNGFLRYLNNMTPSSFDVVAHHLYNGGMAGNDPAPDSFATTMTNAASAPAAAGKPIFMTEFAPQAPGLFNTAWMIQDALTTEGVSAYIYWGLIWAPPTTAGAAPAGLVTIAGADPSSAYTINDTFYAMKHFARWTDPGWTRVGATADASVIRSSAFVSPDGTSLTIVLLNTDMADHVVAVDPGSFAFATTAVYRTSGPSERAASVAYGPSAIPLPAQSIATLLLTP
jgi:glucuronoarabinoxylan endo-1,4-beta-xylanase